MIQNIFNLLQMKQEFLHHIPENEDIIMIKVDKSLANYPVNEVIFSLYDYQGNKLDSTLCENIDIEKPIVNPELLDLITAEDLSKEGIDVFNSNDSFFNSLCKPFTSNNGTSVPLLLVNGLQVIMVQMFH